MESLLKNILIRYRLVLSFTGLSCGRNCTEVEQLKILDDGLLPDTEERVVDLDAEDDLNEILMLKLQSQWPTELRSNVLFYMAG